MAHWFLKRLPVFKHVWSILFMVDIEAKSKFKMQMVENFRLILKKVMHSLAIQMLYPFLMTQINNAVKYFI